MTPTAYTVDAALYLMSAALGLLTCCILLIFSDGDKAKRYLAFSYLALSLGFTCIWLLLSRAILVVPHLYRVGQVFLLLYMPFSWLYIMASISRKPVTGRLFLHFLPALLYIVDYMPFFLSSTAHKVAIVSSDLNNIHEMMRFRQGWFLPDNFERPMRFVQMAFYWVWQVRLVRFSKAAMRKNAVWMRWQYIYLGLQLPVFLPGLIFMFSKQVFLHAGAIPPAAAGVLSTLTLFLYPEILYSIKKNPLMKSKIRHPMEGVLKEDLEARLERLMVEKKPFLDGDFTLKEMADAIGVQQHKLSAYINMAKGKNFADYVNEWRIRHCIELICEKKTTNLNLNGLASKCGFNNRNTFSTAFRRFTGKTPSSYLHSKDLP